MSSLPPAAVTSLRDLYEGHGKAKSPPGALVPLSGPRAQNFLPQRRPSFDSEFDIMHDGSKIQIYPDFP